MTGRSCYRPEVFEKAGHGALRRYSLVLAVLMLAGCIPAGRPPPPSAPSQNAYSPVPTPGPKLATRTGALVEPPAPTWEAKPVTRNARPVVEGVYVVKPGDTLRGIGNRTGAGSEAIARANDIAPPFTIHPGDRLVIPGGRYHSVNGGETGIAIARAYDVPWREIVAANALEEPYILRVGQRLRLPAPGSGAPAAGSVEARAAAFDVGIDDIVTGSQPALAENRVAATPKPRSPKPAVGAIAQPEGFSGRFVWPVTGRILSSFGSKGGGRVNDGINIAAAEGTPFRAAGDGVVAYSGDEIGVFGGLILINHGNGYVSAYGHASRLDVVRGQAVKAGQTIGRVGSTGYVEEPQLHFEIRKNRQPVNPGGYLPERS